MNSIAFPATPIGADLFPVPYDYKKTCHVLGSLPPPVLRGTLEDVVLGHDGGWRFNLNTSIGSFPVRLRWQELSFNVKSGYCWQMRLLLGLRDRTGAVTATNPRPFFNQGREEAAWVPFHHCERESHMGRLRRLLLTLTPSLQTFFLVAMSSYHVQRHYFKRIGAADHHVYPGGLFDQAVEAAEIVAAQRKNITPLEQELAIVATLLLDIGKVHDPFMRFDARRRRLAVAAHPYTEKVLAPAFKALRHLDARLADRLWALFGFKVEEGTEAPGYRVLYLQHLIGWAIGLTWRDSQRLPALKRSLGKPGAKHV